MVKRIFKNLCIAALTVTTMVGVFGCGSVDGSSSLVGNGANQKMMVVDEYHKLAFQDGLQMSGGFSEKLKIESGDTTDYLSGTVISGESNGTADMNSLVDLCMKNQYIALLSYAYIYGEIPSEGQEIPDEDVNYANLIFLNQIYIPAVIDYSTSLQDSATTKDGKDIFLCPVCMNDIETKEDLKEHWQGCCKDDFLVGVETEAWMFAQSFSDARSEFAELFDMISASIGYDF